jgi:hypothetical protein
MQEALDVLFKAHAQLVLPGDAIKAQPAAGLPLPMAN